MTRAKQWNTLGEIVEHMVLVEGELMAARSLYRSMTKPTSKVSEEMRRYVMEELEAYANALVDRQEKLILAINLRIGPDYIR